ncbi:hypothetical protein HanXRQr2_Chr05g0202071 [Helianthus annuus]|uniref:Uncharacterized protein n=1 Tax=Helianthus annuus TaxID=4232 RepID=A0A9K3IY85_HELAN|nr:hypothetical protein HanXRQr2_Chr05g0202071 [Helianthus annuus]
MVDLNIQPPRSVAGGTASFNEDPEASLTGSPLNVIPHNILPNFALNEDALAESRVVEDPKPISTEFPDLHPNGINDDDDGVQNCTFTELISTDQFYLEVCIFFRYYDTPVIMLVVCY